VFPACYRFHWRLQRLAFRCIISGGIVEVARALLEGSNMQERTWGGLLEVPPHQQDDMKQDPRGAEAEPNHEEKESLGAAARGIVWLFFHGVWGHHGSRWR
jgi:hypothetical protein